MIFMSVSAFVGPASKFMYPIKSINPCLLMAYRLRSQEREIDDV